MDLESGVSPKVLLIVSVSIVLYLLLSGVPALVAHFYTIINGNDGLFQCRLKGENFYYLACQPACCSGISVLCMAPTAYL